MLFGGNRTNGVNAGSRASNWNNYVWNSNWNIGSRFACEYLLITLMQLKGCVVRLKIVSLSVLRNANKVMGL